MKRFFVVLLILLMLAGCAVTQPETTTAATEATTATTEPVEEPGLYNPDSRIEKDTNGAVRAYPLNTENCSGMAWMGENLVLFLTQESGTRLLLLAGDNLHVEKTVDLDCYLFPGTAYVQVNENGIAFFDDMDASLVFINPDLQENRRVRLPDDMQGTPVLTSDWKTIYYCTETEIHGLDLNTGISRLVRGECEYSWQSLERIYWNDQVLRWYTSDASGENDVFFISAQTGEILYTTSILTELTTGGDWYYLSKQDQRYPDYLYGHSEQEKRALQPLNPNANMWPVLEQHALATSAIDDTGYDLDYYDLETGRRTASVRLDGVDGISQVVAGPKTGDLWILDYSLENREQTLYLWRTGQSRVNDPEDYSGPYYTAENPDVEGLARCEAEAEEIAARYGCVEVIIGEAAMELEPWDYSFQAEYKVAAFEDGLAALDRALSRYPEGFLQQLAERTDSGVIRISLLRSLNGDPEKGTVTSAAGIQYWEYGDAYIALSLEEQVEQTLHHEMFHMIDTYVLTTCTAYDDWNELNPDGFEYDYDYVKNQERTDFDYLYDENRAFVDTYSMSFPSEDRARVMEYAMLPDNAYLFQPEIMQRKLDRLCEGIRIAFDLDDLEEPLPWEVYLTRYAATGDNG